MPKPLQLIRECRYLAEAPVLAVRGAEGAVADQKGGSSEPAGSLGPPVLGGVRGYAALFNTRSEDLGWGGVAFYEEIKPQAFDGVSFADCVALFNHDNNLPLARYGAGLSLGVDTRGLWYEFELPDTSLGRDLHELIGRGIISQSSFAFTVAEDGNEWFEHGDKDGVSTVLRTITKVSALYDVSLVTRPAYADTTVALRGLYAHKAEQGQRKLSLTFPPEVYALTGIRLPALSQS